MSGTHRADRTWDVVMAALVLAAVVVALGAAGLALTVKNGFQPIVDLQIRREVVRMHCTFTIGGIQKDGEQLVSCVPAQHHL